MVEELGDGEQESAMGNKSGEMSPGEAEISGSALSHSETYFDDQSSQWTTDDSVPPKIREEAARASPKGEFPVYDSQNHVLQSPEISSNINENEVHETVKSLSEKLSAALLNISAKEDLVKQHSKVAEEAVSGWEKAETEVAVLKQQLDVASQKNSAFEDRISHLDGALKECVRQLRQSKEEQEQKVHDVVIRKTQEWESRRSELENQLIELKKQLAASRAEADKLGTIEKQNAALKGKLLALSEELEMQRIESELSTKTAETASKQHLESIKKVAKLEAECRKLRATARKTSSTVNDHKAISSSACVESLTDSLSDNCSDSWASALIAELDQFKYEKSGAKVVTSSVDINLMDDFLEMERLAAMPEVEPGSSSFVLEVVKTSKIEDEVEKQNLAVLEEKVEILENEKAKLEMTLSDCQNQLIVAEGKLIQVQIELNLVNESTRAAADELVSVEAKRRALESQLVLTLLEVDNLRGMVASLEEGKVEESAYSLELKTKLEASEATRVAFESQVHSAYMEIEKLRENVIFIESRVEEECKLSAELAAKLDNMEELKEKVSLLEQRIEVERSLTTEFAAKVDAMKGENHTLEFELELARSKVQKLSDEMSLLERKVHSERALSAQLSQRCQNLEDELLRKRREAELRVVSCLNGELTTKQEKELAVAAEKLAECQKTIASLGQQLKSLTKLDDIMFESEKLNFNGGSPNLQTTNAKTLNTSDLTLPTGKGCGSPPSPLPSSTSTPSRFGRLLSRSGSSDHIDNQ